MRLLPVIALLAACEPPERAPCAVDSDPLLELTPSGVPFGTFVDGDEAYYGPPPQGGAPYSPVDLRVSGLEDMDKGVLIELSAVDVDSGEDLGSLSYPTRLVCANVGDSAGNWLANDVHHRFYGWELDELPGRLMALTVAVTDQTDQRLETSFEAVLVQMD
ncbi:MAG: hypothetical protein EP330_21335 [Deltaproteobacteria bacterium]|nr:MAG: hypothetical protein EP330_21335 [Deltaproteobacteria bacterium]